MNANIAVIASRVVRPGNGDPSTLWLLRSTRNGCTHRGVAPKDTSVSGETSYQPNLPANGSSLRDHQSICTGHS
jgi:hypothetical protein